MLFEGDTSKTPVTDNLSLPVRISDVSAREPSNKPRESSKIDFPAPVSPLKTIKPVVKSASRLSIKTTFLTDKDLSIRFC